MRKLRTGWALVLSAVLTAALLAGCSDPEVVFEGSYDVSGENATGATYSFTLYDDESASVTAMGMTLNVYTWSQSEGNLTNGTVVVSFSGSAGGTSVAGSYTLTIKDGKITNVVPHASIG